MSYLDTFSAYMTHLESLCDTGKRLKIAICLSGHFRLYREIYTNFHKHMYLPCQRCGEVDIFISTWDELNNAASFAVKQEQISPLCGDFDLKDILSKYPATDYLIENFESKKNLFQIHNYDPSIDLSTLNSGIHDNGILFGLAQFYKRFNCNELKRKREMATGKRYDIVVQMRPDVFFLRDFTPRDIKQEKLYARTLYTDTLMVSSSENMDRIAAIHLQAGRIINQYKSQKALWFEPYCPEHFYEHFLKELGFNETNRVELGEDMMWAYPRKNFVPTIWYILNKYHRLSEVNAVLNYPFSTR